MSPATVADLLRVRAEDHHLGLVCGDSRWTWAEVVTAAEGRARRLSSLRGDGPFHVGALMANSPEYLFTLFGAALAGATLVGINSTRRGDELARDITHTDCQLVLTDVDHAGLLDGLDLGDIRVHRVEEPFGDPDGALTPPAAEDLFVLIFTSGSTGSPKAVRMTHARAVRAATGASWLGPDDVLYSAMPLFHGNALNAIVLPAVASGATIALRPRFSASQFMPDIRRHGATFFSTVGRALSYVLATPEAPEDRDNAVKFALAPESSPADMRAFRKRFGITCFAGYGSSENAIIMSPAPGLPDALGIPPEEIDAAVVDPDTLEECPRARFDDEGRLLNATEATGELVGRSVGDRFEGYYGNPDADAARMRNGWFWSGDLAYRNDDGVFFFAGRSGDWLRVDGENFTVAPVERVLSRFPGARAVAVFAVPDERTADDQVMVTIELHDDVTFDPDAFAAFLDEQADLGTKWTPRYVRIGRIPVGATNKLDRRPLRAERWYTDDPFWWRPPRERGYRPFTAADLKDLERRFAEHGRAMDRS